MARTKLPPNTKRDRKPTAKTPAKPLDKVDHAQKMTWKHGIIATVAARFLPKPPKPAPGRSSTSPIIDVADYADEWTTDDGGFQPVFRDHTPIDVEDHTPMNAEDHTPIDAEDHTPIDAEDHKPTQDAEVQTRDWEALAWEIKSEYARELLAHVGVPRQFYG